MSRLADIRPAVRPALKARMSISGPAGSGKTRSMLIIGTVLADGAQILGIDTEKESMLTYADDFAFEHLAWHPPYNPAELAETLTSVGDKYAVIIVDSLSHFWRGQGGTLDVAAGKFTGWKEARPMQEGLIEAILGAQAHMLLGLRAKVEYVQEQQANGKHQVTKLGMASQQDDTLEYELNVAIDMAMDHTATVAKSRTTSLPVLATYRGSQVQQMAETYKAWLANGEPPAEAGAVKDLLARMGALPDQLRRECKAQFFASFGRPEQLRESQLADAVALVGRFEPIPEPIEVAQ